MAQSKPVSQDEAFRILGRRIADHYNYSGEINGGDLVEYIGELMEALGLIIENEEEL